MSWPEVCDPGGLGDLEVLLNMGRISANKTLKASHACVGGVVIARLTWTTKYFPALEFFYLFSLVGAFGCPPL